MQENPMHDLEHLDAPTIEIKSHAYNPGAITVPEGSVIKIINNDEDDHTITSDDDNFDIEISGGSEGEFYPPSKGTYSFYCRYHSDMKGSITVE